ncbi:hypothetical protein FNF28_06729 [Cafeteria roenbergensis]|uniref:Glyceraldehyde 3-phosphate dehydrogenase NAD(P) binding domain-containing protein n=1 Tax=Cafeteria roenbergensis TaxID=33653 RepID=A0A5A8CSE0_CAFRO|nr:hypothetical protein FNF28_06729 [Cafeteria roenbergensis]
MAAAAASSAPATKLAETGATGLCSVGVSSTTLKDFNTGLAACEKMLPSSVTCTAPTSSLAIVTALAKLKPGLKPWRFDVGFARARFASIFDSMDALSEEGQKALTAKLAEELAAAEETAVRGDGFDKPTDVVLYGHGRIGRLLNRMLVEKSAAGGKLVLRAIVVRQKASSRAIDLEKRASLLKKDSVHGDFEGTVSFDSDSSTIVANGNPIRIIYASAPEDVDYTAYGIHDAIVVDNTGAFRTKEALERHRKCPGVKTVVLTAPASGGGVPTVVAGVNNDRITADEHIYSAASCTTNAIVPILKLLHETCGVESGHIETVHSFTNDQHLVDGMHKKSRRGRSAALNMVPTETGAAKAVAKAVPELAGILTASAIRVPTPNVSMALLILRPKSRPVVADDLYRTLKGASIAGALHNQIAFSEDPDAVSTDFVGSRSACVVDWPASIVSDDRIVIKAWYDNEAGYSAQVIRLLQRLAGLVFPDYPTIAPDVLLTPKLKPITAMRAVPDIGAAAEE